MVFPWLGRVTTSVPQAISTNAYKPQPPDTLHVQFEIAAVDFSAGHDAT
jgi:hypothetical protein